MSRQPRLLFIDAYDSFAENIIALIRQSFQADVVAIKIDQDPQQYDDQFTQFMLNGFEAIVLGPGPGNPRNSADVGLFNRVWQCASLNSVPVLGICLGFQSLCLTSGLRVTKLGLPCHGQPKSVHHTASGVFRDVGPVTATCYNSLGVECHQPARWVGSPRPQTPVSPDSHSAASTHPSDSEGEALDWSQVFGRTHFQPLTLLAWDDDGYIMAVKHKWQPFWGLQFHPESCKSDVACHAILRNWWSDVQKHNKTSKRLSHSRAYRPLPTPSDWSPPLSNCSNDLFKALSALTTDSTGIQSCYRNIPSTLSHQQLRQFCYGACEPDAVAMLESTRNGRFSIYPFTDNSTFILECFQNRCRILKQGKVTEMFPGSLTEAMRIIEDFMVTKLIATGPQDVPFWGGFIGFFSYEFGLELMNIRRQENEALTGLVPDFSLMWVDRSVIVDHQEGTTTIQSTRPNDERWLASMQDELSSLSLPPPPSQSMTLKATTTLPSHTTYTSHIQTCQSHLYAGNSYELCLTTSATISHPLPSVSLYTLLQTHNPAPYSSFLSLNKTHILSSSPEHFLSWSRSTPHLDMKPMKGTLAKSPSLNPTTARELLATPKEQAENLMIADLIRHDLHATLGPAGHVEVVHLHEMVETEHQYQLISHIRGHISLASSDADADTDELQRRKSIMRHGHRALRHTLPPGSMTGAPKRRSCEILREVERRDRGVYSGVIGYFDVGGGGCWSVAIRMAFSREGAADETVKSGEGEPEEKNEEEEGRTWHVGAGGAVTVLSTVEGEWEEMRGKMAGVLRGLGVEDA